MEKPNKPGDSDFKQQRLRGWRCAPNSLVLGCVYVGLGAFFIALGAIILDETGKVSEVGKRYDDIAECRANWRTPRACVIELTLHEDMDSPVFFYYEVKNFYQNHRKYNKSRDIYQLMGDSRSKSEIRESCTPIVTMEDLGFYTNLDLDEDAPASPCGLVAKSYFNDTYSLLRVDSDEEIPIIQHNIAWGVDRDEKFERAHSWDQTQWVDVENEHFIVWMSTAGLPNFRKLWGRIEQDLSAGTYRLIIINHYDVSSFDGQKHVILSTTSAFGGKLEFMGVLYILVGALALAGAGVMFTAHLVKRRLN